MSLFGSLMGDVEEDPFFGSHMRHMRHMNNVMNSLFSDPFGMMGGGPLAIGGPRHGSSMNSMNSMMPFMPQMPSINRLFSGDLEGMGAGMGAASTFSSSTVMMSNGPNGKPQVISQTSSTKIGPNGIKETRKTLQDSRTGTKKMAIGHHIGERGHVIEREQNVYSGDAEERQEFINIEEEEAEDFDKEFQVKAGSALSGRMDRAIHRGPHCPAPVPRRDASRLAIMPAPAPTNLGSEPRRPRPAPRRPIRTEASPLTTSTSVREVYGSSHPQRHRHKQHKHRNADN